MKAYLAKSPLALACTALLLCSTYAEAGKPAKNATPAAPAAEAAPAATAAAPTMSGEQQQAYALGIMQARTLKESAGIDDLDMDAFIRGIRDGYQLEEKQWQLSIQQMEQPLIDLKSSLERKRAEKIAKVQNENRAAGEAFLAANAQKPGVKTTASGLQYEVITEGTGPSPKAGDTVEALYKGTFVNGEIFDESKDNQSVKFPLDQVIPGWTEGLQLMKVGGRYHFVLPAVLAYGEMGQGQIPPNAVLQFDVELLGVQPAAAVIEPTSSGNNKGKKKK